METDKIDVMVIIITEFSFDASTDVSLYRQNKGIEVCLEHNGIMFGQQFDQSSFFVEEMEVIMRMFHGSNLF